MSKYRMGRVFWDTVYKWYNHDTLQLNVQGVL